MATKTKRSKTWKFGIPYYRFFDGKRYYLWSMVQSKDGAKFDAHEYKREGYNVRIVKIPPETGANWALYRRKRR